MNPQRKKRMSSRNNGNHVLRLTNQGRRLLAEEWYRWRGELQQLEFRRLTNGESAGQEEELLRDKVALVEMLLGADYLRSFQGRDPSGGSEFA